MIDPHRKLNIEHWSDSEPPTLAAVNFLDAAHSSFSLCTCSLQSVDHRIVLEFPGEIRRELLMLRTQHVSEFTKDIARIDCCCAA
jgi:hypothetical protein